MTQQQTSEKVETIEIRIPAKPQFLKIIRAAVGSICEISGICLDDLHNVILAVDEACSNIIKHTYGGPSDEPIRATILICQGKIEIRLRDFGKKIDIKKIKPRKLDEIRPGGLGVHFINAVMDEVEYDNQFEQGNQVKLVKYIEEK
ncbi:MAG: ATP-binding protein [Calditrichaeota bacterium]|nr:ATP-binding protein [Calditrichota bacterium]